MYFAVQYIGSICLSGQIITDGIFDLFGCWHHHLMENSNFLSLRSYFDDQFAKLASSDPIFMTRCENHWKVKQ